MKTFVTSDTHFGHENIIRYTRRPFESSHHMDIALAERWNARVGEHDTVYFLGDFAMGRGVDAEFVFTTLMGLNGNIKVVLGNHDEPSKWSDGLEVFVAKYRDQLDRVEILGKEAHEIRVDGKTFVLYHYPMVDWDGRFKGTIHLHGHTHGRILPEDCDKVEDDTVDAYGGPVELTGDLRHLNDPTGWE